jgi:hypothetical protein
MRKWLALLAAVALAPAACGEERVSDLRIVGALDLERAADRPVYAIEGDPFCEVSVDLLNDADEVQRATASDEVGLVITDSDGTVGVQAVPPFDPSCEQKVKRALNGL